MNLTRREFLAAGAAALPTLPGSAAEPPSREGRQRLGVVAYCYSIRMGAERKRGATGLADPLAFFEQCRRIGAGGMQFALGVREKDYTTNLRQKLEASGMYLEGIIRLPQDRSDVDRFAAEVRVAKEAGARVLRTVLLSGRRYETFDTAAAFHRWRENAFASLALAEPVAARRDVRLAVENHKDLRVGELLDVLKRLDSRHVGVCVDTGNSIALLEDPLEVVEAYAPWAFSTHMKNVAVAEYDEGFLLAEVPLGEGILDLKKIVAVLHRAHPEVHFNLEMITRDPLKVPCLASKYWASSENLPGRYLARTLSWVRKHRPRMPLPHVTGLDSKQQLAAEEDNVRKSLAYAREHLGL
jgi:sugar phosphate isomerase/epimerase